MLKSKGKHMYDPGVAGELEGARNGRKRRPGRYPAGGARH